MYKRLKEAFNCLNKEYRNNHFSPIIEDDFLARIYYHILKHNKELNSKIFLKTRIFQNIPQLRKNKYDLVVGERIENRNEVYVEPDLVAEFKIFPVGFSSSILSKRRNQSAEDISKLNDIFTYSHNKTCLVFCFFDVIGWLKGSNQIDNNTRLEKLIEFRDSINSSIKILGISAINKDDKRTQIIEF